MSDADFRSFIKGERQKLIHYVRSLFRDTADMDAEDVVHDVLVKLLERPGSADLGSVAGYAYRSLKNRVIDSSRTRKPTVSLDAEPHDGPGLSASLQDHAPGLLDQLQSEEGRAALFEALTKLSEIERQVVIANEFEGVPFRELSAAWNIPLNTLLSHKSRAMKKLKEHLLHSNPSHSE